MRWSSKPQKNASASAADIADADSAAAVDSAAAAAAADLVNIHNGAATAVHR